MYIRNGGLVLEQRSIYGAYYVGSLRNSALTIDLYKSKTLKIVLRVFIEKQHRVTTVST